MEGKQQNVKLATSGTPLGGARTTVITIHGRGATAESILSLSEVIARPDIAYLAPQAPGGTWYPYSFLEPLEKNEPALSSSLRTITETVEKVKNAGIPEQRIVLLGFSQGACLALEVAARQAAPYGGIVALSGGLIGTGEVPDKKSPDEKRFEYTGDLSGTTVFLGCSDVDPHIPVSRVHVTADVFGKLGAEVTKRIYPGMGHTINEDEIEFIRDLLTRIDS